VWHLEIESDVALAHPVPCSIAVSVAGAFAPQHRVPVRLTALPRWLVLKVRAVMLQIFAVVGRVAEYLHNMGRSTA
jgi:hypothetical protein